MIKFYRLKDQLANKPAEIDLQRMTSESRFCRMEMVQTLGQYRFLHDVAIFMLNKYGVTSRANREDADNFEESMYLQFVPFRMCRV